jgi:hypothetical protein
LLGYTSYVCVRMQRNGIVKDLSGVAGNFGDLNKMAGLYFSGWVNSDTLENQLGALGAGTEVANSSFRKKKRWLMMSRRLFKFLESNI